MLIKEQEVNIAEDLLLDVVVQRREGVFINKASKNRYSRYGMKRKNMVAWMM